MVPSARVHLWGVRDAEHVRSQMIARTVASFLYRIAMQWGIVKCCKVVVCAKSSFAAVF